MFYLYFNINVVTSVVTICLFHSYGSASKKDQLASMLMLMETQLKIKPLPGREENRKMFQDQSTVR